MEKSGKAGGTKMMASNIFTQLYNLLRGANKTPKTDKGVSKPSYAGSTGSFKQNQRRERKASHCRRVKTF